MKEKLTKASIILISVIILFSSITLYSYAKTENQLKNEKEQLQQSWNDANSKQKEVQGQKTQVEQKVQELNTKIIENEREIQELKNEITTLESEIQEKQQKLDKAQADYEKQDELLKKRIVASYMAGETKYLDILLTSESLTDLISDYYRVSEMAKYDTELLERLEKQKKEIEEAKQLLETKRAELKVAKAETEKKNVVLRNDKTEQNNLLNQLSDTEKQLQQKIKEYEASMKEVENQIANLTQSIGSGGNYTGGQFLWPIPSIGVGKNITSNFGYRYLELYGYTRLHAGIDIGANYGTNVVAAAEGTVVLASWNGGYGNCVIINHGGGLMTLYGHGSSIVAKVGQKVKRGDVVLKVGSTGNSTGNHLHFEVRVNGTAKNPRPYLGI